MAALNMPPLRNLNSFGSRTPSFSNSLGGMKSMGGSLSRTSQGGSRPLRDKPKSVFENFDISEVGHGRLMTEGSYHKEFGTKRYSGLKGQLEKLKWSGRRGVTKNLSQGNIEQMHDLIADRLKKKAAGSATFLSRRDEKAIMKESRKIVKAGGGESHFTKYDRQDLKKVVSSIRQQAKEQIIHRADREEGNNGSVPGNVSAPLINKDLGGTANLLTNRDSVDVLTNHNQSPDNFGKTNSFPSEFALNNNHSEAPKEIIKPSSLKDLEEKLNK